VDYLERNLDVLGKRDPVLARLVREADPPPEMKVFPSVSGAPTLFYVNGNGKGHFINSPKDPEREVLTLLGGKAFPGTEATVLLGMGLGYLPREIRARMSPGHDLFIVCHDPGVLKLSFTHLDLRDVIEDTRIRFCTGMDSTAFPESLREILPKVISGALKKLVYTPATTISPGYYRDIEAGVDAYAGDIKASIVSFKEQIPARLENLFNNIGALLQAASAKSLQGLFPKIPAVVVSAGPSLDKNISLLKEAVNGSVVICVDAALRSLFKAGVVPHVAATLDILPSNIRKVEGLSPVELEKVSLVFAPEAFPDVIKKFKGPRFFVNAQNTFSNWLVGLLGDLPDFPRMSTVSHLAFVAARHLGCDPIILAGFDFSFPEGRHHVTGSARTWAPDLTGWDLIEIEDVHGGRVKTFNHFIFMLRLLEREISRTDAQCIDATEGGALIRGTRVMTMGEALNEFLAPDSVDVYDSLRLVFSKNRTRGRQGLRDGLEWMNREMEFTERIVRQAIDLIRGPIRGGVLRSLQELRNRVLERNTFDILGDFLTDLLLFESIHDKGKHGDAKASPGCSQEELKAYAFFFRELEKALDTIRPRLRECRIP